MESLGRCSGTVGILKSLALLTAIVEYTVLFEFNFLLSLLCLKTLFVGLCLHEGDCGSSWSWNRSCLFICVDQPILIDIWTGMYIPNETNMVNLPATHGSEGEQFPSPLYPLSRPSNVCKYTCHSPKVRHSSATRFATQTRSPRGWTGVAALTTVIKSVKATRTVKILTFTLSKFSQLCPLFPHYSCVSTARK